MKNRLGVAVGTHHIIEPFFNMKIWFSISICIVHRKCQYISYKASLTFTIIIFVRNLKYKTVFGNRVINGLLLLYTLYRIVLHRPRDPKTNRGNICANDSMLAGKLSRSI